MRCIHATRFNPVWHSVCWLLMLGLASPAFAQSWQATEGMSAQDIFNLAPQPQSAQNWAGNPTPSTLVGVPADVPSLIQWVVAHQDARGLPFVIADKPRGRILVVGEAGNIIAESPALYGKYVGDAARSGQTPAGEFVLQKNYTDEPGYGGDVMFFWSEGGDDYALHRTYRLYPNERRPQRLASATTSDNRISNGCINVPEAFYDEVVGNMHGAKLYVLPETSSTFRAINRGLATYYAGAQTPHPFHPAVEDNLDTRASHTPPQNTKDPLRYW